VRSAFRSVTEPVLRPLRAILPPVRLGGVGLDLSPLVLLIALGILAAAIC
jgi:YggT family protein